jgi:recombinational DNA repair protein RecR
MASASADPGDDIEAERAAQLDALRAMLDDTEQLVAVLQALVFRLTGAVVCRQCHGLQRSEMCPRCRGLEGMRWADRSTPNT